MFVLLKLVCLCGSLLAPGYLLLSFVVFVGRCDQVSAGHSKTNVALMLLRSFLGIFNRSNE